MHSVDKSSIFDGKAGFYCASRPNYAEKLIETIYTSYGFSEKSVIADVGSGTGIFAEQLLLRHSYVYCIEPNQEMRMICQQKLHQYTRCAILNGHAAETGLLPNFVDFVTAAQAFHWFDPGRFREECRRVLRLNGKVLLVWHMRDSQSPVMKAVHGVHQRYCPDFSKSEQRIAYNDSKILHFFQGRYEKLEFEHPLKYNRNQFINRNLSSSYSLRQGDIGFEGYKCELEGIFETYASDGIVSIPNRTVAYIGDVQNYT